VSIREISDHDTVIRANQTEDSRVEIKGLQMKTILTAGLVLLVGGVCCDGGVNQVVNVHSQKDALVKSQKRQDAKAKAKAAEAIRRTLKEKLGMPDATIAGLTVEVMPEAMLLAGAKDPTTGLCIVLGTKEGGWTILQMGTTLDRFMVKAAAWELIGNDGTVGSGIDPANLGHWTHENCTNEGAVSP
jgi:hypothetical protein